MLIVRRTVMDDVVLVKLLNSLIRDALEAQSGRDELDPTALYNEGRESAFKFVLSCVEGRYQ